MTEEIELIYSPLQRSIVKEGQTIQVKIYKSADSGWFLEVVDEFDNSTCWDDQFLSDQDALDEILKAVEEEGINAFVGRASDASLH